MNIFPAESVIKSWGLTVEQWRDRLRSMTPDELRHDELSRMHDRVCGVLEDEGWPVPLTKIIHPELTTPGGGYVAWRRSEERDRSVIVWETRFITEPCGERTARHMNHHIRFELIRDGRFILASISNGFCLVNTDSSTDDIIETLRHFRSVIDR